MIGVDNKLVFIRHAGSRRDAKVSVGPKGIFFTQAQRMEINARAGIGIGAVRE